MRSITKPTVDQATVDALVAASFGPDALPAPGVEATEGMYNTVFRVTLADGTAAILKAAPAPDTPRLTYERDILRTEALFLSRAADLPGVPAPRVLATGYARTLVAGDFVFMTALPGEPLDKVGADLAPAEAAVVRRDLGRIVAALHTVHGDAFGYPQADAPAARWSDAFLGMVEAVLADADRLGADLTRPAGEILAAVKRNVGLLDAVGTPVLVHFDLWDGNVLVVRDAEGGGARVGGVIDAERAFWGDPAADFVSLALFGDIEGDGEFLAGYQEAGGPVAFTPAVRRRIRMYRVYLYLIMLTEGSTRGYPEEQAAALREWIGSFLGAELAELSAPFPAAAESAPSADARAEG
ncbi:aminoglycoside phosphotransferase family protein [Streptomycetaceae bacterium NBC_01309]